MNGPFFCERMLFGLPLHNELVGSFVVPCFVAQRGYTPWSQRVITLDAAFPSAMRMIDGIHHDPAHCWTNSHVTRTSGLSDRDVFVIEISDLADRGHAIDVDEPYFSRRKLHVSVGAFLGHELRRSAGAASHLRAFSGTKLDVVNGRAERNIFQRQ